MLQKVFLFHRIKWDTEVESVIEDGALGCNIEPEERPTSGGSSTLQRAVCLLYCGCLSSAAAVNRWLIPET